MKYYLTVSSVIEVPIIANFSFFFISFYFYFAISPLIVFCPVGHDANSHDYFMIHQQCMVRPPQLNRGCFVHAFCRPAKASTSTMIRRYHSRPSNSECVRSRLSTLRCVPHPHHLMAILEPLDQRDILLWYALFFGISDIFLLTVSWVVCV